MCFQLLFEFWMSTAALSQLDADFNAVGPAYVGMLHVKIDMGWRIEVRLIYQLALLRQVVWGMTVNETKHEHDEETVYTQFADWQEASAACENLK